MILFVAASVAPIGAVPKEGPQLGAALVAAAPGILGGVTPAVLLEATSSRAQRVCRSSMACVAAALAA